MCVVGKSGALCLCVSVCLCACVCLCSGWLNAQRTRLTPSLPSCLTGAQVSPLELRLTQALSMLMKLVDSGALALNAFDDATPILDLLLTVSFQLRAELLAFELKLALLTLPTNHRFGATVEGVEKERISRG